MQPVAERGGSDQALLRLVRSLPPDEFDFHIALPGPTPLADEFAHEFVLNGADTADVLVGPLLRYVGSETATIWLETTRACEVAILGQRTRTFHVTLRARGDGALPDDPHARRDGHRSRTWDDDSV